MMKGGFGGMNMQQLMKQAQAMQQKLDESVVTAKSGGNLVEVTMNGKYELQSIRINPNAVDMDDLEMLEDLIMASINDATAQIKELEEQLAPKLPNGMGAF
jgi:nucleoid-associated protein EbfC